MSTLILGTAQSDVLQGAQIILTQQFQTFPGSGYAAPASSVTIGINAATTPGAGAGQPVPVTAAGITTVDFALYSYTWACDPEQTTGDYLATWTGTVNGVTQTYVQAITVAAVPAAVPAPGVYATVTQYQNQTGDMVTPVMRVAATLRRASDDIDGNLIGAVYPVNQNGMPTDPFAIDVFMRACCEQCAWLLADNDPTGIKRQYSSTSMGGVSQTRAASMTGLTMPPLAPRAAQILHINGVLPNAPLISW